MGFQRCHQHADKRSAMISRQIDRCDAEALHSRHYGKLGSKSPIWSARRLTALSILEDSVHMINWKLYNDDDDDDKAVARNATKLNGRTLAARSTDPGTNTGICVSKDIVQKTAKHVHDSYCFRLRTMHQ